MKMKIKNILHRYDINRPSSSYGHKCKTYTNYLIMMMHPCIKQHLSNI